MGRKVAIKKRIPVNELLDRLTTLTSSLSDEVKLEFGQLSSAQLNWRPKDKSWSIAQCLAHLNAYYRYYNPVFNGKISNSRFTKPGKFFTSSPLGTAVARSVKLGKVKNVKRKLKARKEYNPSVNKSLSTKNALEEYLEHQNDFLELLNSSMKVNLRKTKCPLSLRPVVKLNLGDALIYMAYHNERHIEQAKRLKLSPNFPA
jgi:hypothetical protein